jgi:hypothetical protein
MHNFPINVSDKLLVGGRKEERRIIIRRRNGANTIWYVKFGGHN